MVKEKMPLVSLTQLEEALEERVTPDRRKADRGLPKNVAKDRRKGDRRTVDSQEASNSH